MDYITPKDPGNVQSWIDTGYDNVLRALTSYQWPVYLYMAENPAASKKQAANACDLEAESVYKWDKRLDAAVWFARLDTHNAVRAERTANLRKALRVFLAGLDSDDEKTRLKVAKDIIEMELGKATQYADVTSGGESIQIVFDRDAILGSDD